jgi:hypothetical protein
MSYVSMFNGCHVDVISQLTYATLVITKDGETLYEGDLEEEHRYASDRELLSFYTAETITENGSGYCRR